MKRGLEIGTVVLLLMGAAIVSRSLIVRYMHPRANAKLYQQLTGEKSDDAQRFDALQTLAKLKDPAALKVARNWIKLDTVFYQMGAVQALSYYDDKDVLPAIEKALPQLEDNVRIRALTYFSKNNYTAERQAWFTELTKSTSPSIEIEGRIFLLTGETDQNAIADVLNNVFVDFAQLDAPAQQRILEMVSAQFGGNQAVSDWLLKIVAENHPAHMQAIAIAQLSAVKASGLDTHIARLAHNAEPEVRAAAIAAIPRVCPHGLWSILDEAAKTEPNIIVLSRVLDDLSTLKGKEATKALSVVKARDGKLPKAVESRLLEVERDLASAPQTNACAK